MLSKNNNNISNKEPIHFGNNESIKPITGKSKIPLSKQLINKEFKRRKVWAQSVKRAIVINKRETELTVKKQALPIGN